MLGILEIFVPGIFLVWMAAAAAVTGLVVCVRADRRSPFQLAIFALLAIAAVYGGRRHYARNPVDERATPMLNDRTARLIGQTVTVVDGDRERRGPGQGRRQRLARPRPRCARGQPGQGDGCAGQLPDRRARRHPAPARGRGLIVLSRAILAALSLLLAGSASAQPPAGPQAIGRTELQRHDLGIAGREAVQVRVDFSPGAVTPRHRHPGEELVFVLRGSIELRIEGREPVTLRPGDTAFIPSGAVHQAHNAGAGGASVLATYVVEKGRPLVSAVP